MGKDEADMSEPLVPKDVDAAWQVASMVWFPWSSAVKQAFFVAVLCPITQYLSQVPDFLVDNTPFSA